MGSVWVVDSNCFIHLGQKAEDGFVDDLTAVLQGRQLLITPGVEKEVATVALRRCEGRPNLLKALKPMLHSVPVDEDDVRALAQRIGETAAPQDVDLSLMVLADGLGGESGEVVLVSDDFKMTTTAERVDLRFETCPPSTFLQRLVADAPDESRDARFRSLSRQVRAAEMKYAISRRSEYDVQRKLTWMVDSLLSSSHALEQDEEEEADRVERRQIADLTRVIRGYKIKPKRLEALGELPSICAPVSRLDAHLSTLRMEADERLSDAIEATSSLLTDVMEEVGMALAPLGEEQAEIAHRAMAGSLLRTESALGLMARMADHHQHARRHLARALHLATLVDDVGSERKAMRRLGMLALQSGNDARALDLFTTAANQPASQESDAVPSMVLAAIASSLTGDASNAKAWVSKASAHLMEDPAVGSSMLERVGKALLAIDRPELAIELFDEAMECAMMAKDDDRYEALNTCMVQAELAIDDSERKTIPVLRRLLDGLTPTEQVQHR
jgi:rRNA maturation endonuclease Nob1/tetratricopeptide (TPR) repeat protein